MEDKVADIIVNINHIDVDKIFNYEIPLQMQDLLKLGSKVIVPFGKGNKFIEGYVVGIGGEVKNRAYKLKSISKIVDEVPIFDEKSLKLIYWMKERYCCTLSACIQCIMPKKFNSNVKVEYVELNDDINISEESELLQRKGYKAQLKAVSYLNQFGKVTLTELKKVTNISKTSIDKLIKDNIICKFKEDKFTEIFNNVEINDKKNELNNQQSFSVSQVISNFKFNQCKIFLLHGITGSGKTEVYMKIIEKTISMGKQAIVLVPEISLTPQIVQRFVSRFTDKVGFTHSRLSSKERNDQWIKPKQGKISIMLGPRSAVFTPFSNLGIIIIDEEHESTYKSDITPKYNTLEVAKKLCEINHCVLLLGSATPSLESYYKAKNGEYNLLELNQRATKSTLPLVKVIDMREELKEGNMSIFSKELIEKIYDKLLKREQIILFLNRRGHSTFISCRNCGHVLKCDNCDVPYTFHAIENKLICHYCGVKKIINTTCPECGSKHIKYFGVGTQRVEKEVLKRFPNARTLRMDLDTTTKKHSHEDILKKFEKNEADILIGTQMIAKGLDYPNVTLVGVIAADLTLFSSNFRASEKTFQLLTQVAGRAGRGTAPGEVLIQTYNPQHYSITTAKNHDYHDFYNKEILMRQTMGYPPFTNIFTYLITGEEELLVIESANRLGEILKYYGENKDFIVLGPVPAVISKVKKQYRWRILIKCSDYSRLKNYGVYCLEKFRKYYKYNIIIQIDINPTMIN